MATFKWRDTLTVTVSEMSRTRALECVRQFDSLATVYVDYVELLRETDILAVLYAPAVVKTRDGVLVAGDHTIVLDDGETLKLTLPPTSATFNALPMSLTEEWITAAVMANGWLIETLKKVLSLTSENKPATKSGSGPFFEPMPNRQPMTTTGG